MDSLSPPPSPPHHHHHHHHHLLLLLQEEDFLYKKDAKGVIILSFNSKREESAGLVELRPNNFPGEFIIHAQKRSYVMRAESEAAAMKWSQILEQWANYRKNFPLPRSVSRQIHADDDD